jgi:hypothetical protein
MRTPRHQVLRAVRFLALWMLLLLHCGSELVSAVPPRKCHLPIIDTSLSTSPSHAYEYVTLFELPGDMQLAGTTTAPTLT